MTAPTAVDNLAAALRERGSTGYVLTVSDQGTPHVAPAAIAGTADGLVADVGDRSVLNAQARPRITLLFPARHPDDYSLIVDAVATITTATAGRLRVVPTRAVLHRPAVGPVPAAAACGSDCVVLSLEPTR